MIPERLKKGDTIGVIAPSNSIDEDDNEFILKSSKLFEDLGFNIKFGEFVFSHSLGYGASPLEKAKDVNTMFADSNVKAIFCVKGGENSNTTFDYLNYDLIKDNPKIICGFSDSTSITNVITSKTGLVTFSGPTFKSLTSWETDYSFKEVIKRFVNKDLDLGVLEDKFETLVEGVATGKLIGKHKMSPVLSPKKSVEGAIGGVLGTGLLTGIYSYFVLHSVRTVVVLVIISMIAAVVSMFGDLTASAIKRFYDIKDYGKLIPGHGGILDRFDSVIIVAPIIYYLIYYFLV